tara:strand:- start:1051 stop:1719 length:669 start_codon:yes stop_codon:yes gene_type:complete
MSEQLELFESSSLTSEDHHAAPLTSAPAARPLPEASFRLPTRVPKVVHPRSGPDRFLIRIAVFYAMELELPKLAERVSVSWNSRMRTAAGRAFFQTDQIELNPKLQDLPEASRDREIFGTFLHELAHLVSYARADGQRILPHGPEWKQACRDLGIPDEDRCHNLDFPSRKMKRSYTYECPVCGSVVERVRKIKRAVACYDCCRTYNGGEYDNRFRLVEKVIA